MIVILAIDDIGGMMFHGRRQSSDRVLREKILHITKEKKLWMNLYSAKQFVETEGKEQLMIDEDFLLKAEDGDYCFVENVPLLSLEKIEQIILFKWNRRYPNDFCFDMKTLEQEWKMSKQEEFAGFSHEKITMEVYCREN